MMNDTRDLIIAFRGGVAERCDFCNEPLDAATAIPEEAGQWCCPSCRDKFEAELKELRRETDADNDDDRSLDPLVLIFVMVLGLVALAGIILAVAVG